MPLMPLRCIGLLAALLLATPGALGQSKERSLQNLESRTDVSSYRNGHYIVDVYDLSDDNFYGRLLEIRCLSCKPEYVYREIIDDMPAYTFALSPELVLTEWSTAVASGIRVYHLGKEVRLVLKFFGRGGPRYTYSGWGEPQVITYDYRDEDLLETYHRAIWMWNGNEFVETIECIAGCEALRKR